MPIKFRCRYCHQLLGIARRKAGNVVACPTCSRSLTVPYEDQVEETEPKGPATAGTLLEASDFDRWIGKSEQKSGRKAAAVAVQHSALPASSGPQVEDPESGDLPFKAEPGPARIAAPVRIPAEGILSRTTLLIACAVVVLLAAFALGVFVGRHTVQPTGSNANKPAQAAVVPANQQDVAEPVRPEAEEAAELVVRGTIFYQQAGSKKPDAGASVIAFPSTQQPIQKVPSLGLRPADRNLQNRPGVELLERYGGALTYVDEAGDFELNVEEPGVYWVLILSRRQTRDSQEYIYVDDQAILQKFFDDITGLLGEGSFLLITKEIPSKRSEPFSYTFTGK